jgi:hypothetical protein
MDFAAEAKDFLRRGSSVLKISSGGKPAKVSGPATARSPWHT